MSDLYQQVQDIDERVTTLEDNALTNDMNFDTMTNLTDFMQGNFWYFGQTTLVSGSSVVNMSGITPLSLAFITPTTNKAFGGTGFHTIAAACTVDTLTITSTDGADGRVVNYWVLI